MREELCTLNHDNTTRPFALRRTKLYTVTVHESEHAPISENALIDPKFFESNTRLWDKRRGVVLHNVGVVYNVISDDSPVQHTASPNLFSTRHNTRPSSPPPNHRNEPCSLSTFSIGEEKSVALQECTQGQVALCACDTERSLGDWVTLHTKKIVAGMSSDVGKSWQSIGSPARGFKTKKQFMPRMLRAKGPDHFIGFGSAVQVRCYRANRIRRLRCKTIAGRQRQTVPSVAHSTDCSMRAGQRTRYQSWSKKMDL